MSDMKLFGLLSAGTLALIALAYLFEVGAAGANCYFLETQIERPTKFHVINGCFVRVRKQWVPERNWRETEGSE